MENKPVAWVKELSFGTGSGGYKYADGVKNLEVGTPLYTAPRELSDEEIKEVIDGTWWVGTEEEIRFKIAKAVLEKASEK